MAYKKQTFQTGDVLTAENLNKLSAGLEEVDKKVLTIFPDDSDATIAMARQNLAFIGTNPIASVADDTPANWMALGTGHAYINGSGKLKSQPTASGYLETRVYGTSRVEQIFKSNMSGSTMLRTWKRAGGASSGWFKEWALILDETNGIQKKELWKNASPTRGFAGQEISLDLSGYAAVEIDFNFSTVTSYGVVDNMRVDVGKGGYCTSVYSATLARRVFTTSNSGIVFQDGGMFSTYGSLTITTANTCLIPAAIYGIKGVQ